MARGRRSAGEVAEIHPDVSPATNPEEVGGEGHTSLFDFSGDARVRVLHRNEKTQRYEPHGYFPVEATEESILNEFGGGRYRVQLLVRDETGREVIKTQREIDLPGAYKVPAGDLPGIGSRNGAPKSEPATVGTIAAAGGSGDLMEVLKAGIINTLLELMKTSKETRAVGPDPMLLKLMETQAQTQTQMMQFMLTLATKDSGDSKKDVLDMMAKMKELVTPPVVNGVPTDPMQMFNNMLETFKSFREAAEDVAPQPASYDPMSAIPKLVEVVAEEHQMRKNAAMTHVPTPAPHGGTAQMPHVGTIEIPMWRRILQQQGARLLTQAAAKSDPDVIAGASILFAPPAVREALLGFFKRDENEVMADILTEIPQLAEHREWLAEFVQCAQERLFPEEFVEEGAEETEVKE